MPLFFRQQCNRKVPSRRNLVNIGKTVHVTSVAQLQICHATRILFFAQTKQK